MKLTLDSKNGENRENRRIKWTKWGEKNLDIHNSQCLYFCCNCKPNVDNVFLLITHWTLGAGVE